MKLISHRGNTVGPMESWENEPTYIDLAISKGYDVEVDVWLQNGIFYLGHDKPNYGIGYNWISERTEKLWIHAKDLECFRVLKDRNENVFYHTTEKVVLTNLGYSWYYTGENSFGGICVLPETNKFVVPNGSIGICSDFIEKFKK